MNRGIEGPLSIAFAQLWTIAQLRYNMNNNGGGGSPPQSSAIYSAGGANRQEDSL